MINQLTQQIKHDLTDIRHRVNDMPTLANVLLWHALQKERNEDSFFDVFGIDNLASVYD